jgi:hypothetical protein
MTMQMYNWSKEWPVDFNPKKTECIIFSTNQAANKPCIVFNNENVKFVERAILLTSYTF